MSIAENRAASPFCIFEKMEVEMPGLYNMEKDATVQRKRNRIEGLCLKYDTERRRKRINPKNRI